MSLSVWGKHRVYKLTLNESSETESPVSDGFFQLLNDYKLVIYVHFFV